MSDCRIRAGCASDQSGAYYVCLKTGDYGKDGEPFYREDPDALGRVFVGPYLAFEPELSLILEDEQGICGYAFGVSYRNSVRLQSRTLSMPCPQTIKLTKTFNG